MSPLLETAEDSTLIRLALAGQAECFAALMDRHLLAVQRHISRRIPNATDADDILQNVLLKVWHRLSTFRSESTFRTWMTSVAINEVLQLYRRQRARPICHSDINLDFLACQADSPHQALVRADRARSVRNAVAKLPEIYRQVIVLCEFEHRSILEAATSLGLTPSAVKSRLLRARRLLAASLGNTCSDSMAA